MKNVQAVSSKYIFFTTLVFLWILVVPQRVLATTTGPFIVPTLVNLSVCGDAIVDPGEVCDDGVNSGLYSISIADSTCTTDCQGFAPFCGDSILQSTFDEECDDGNNTPNDHCSASCKDEQLPTGGGSGGSLPQGSTVAPNPTKVIIQGKAYPNSDVNILRDGVVIGIVRSDNLANFSFTTTGITPGIATFGMWAEDFNKLRSVALTLTFEVVQAAVTTVTGALLPPTITTDKLKVSQGEVINISGTSVPNAKVVTHINSEEEVIEEISTDEVGLWELPFDTTPLRNDEFHTAKALFEAEDLGTILKSGFSQAVTFFVGDRDVEFPSSADLNRDGFVNLIDFSILLFHWGTDGGVSDPPADINQDGFVNLPDFSIMLFQWTG